MKLGGGNLYGAEYEDDSGGFDNEEDYEIVQMNNH